MTTELYAQVLGQFARCGFTLRHPDDHVVILVHEEEEIACFSQTGATEQSIQAECAAHLIENQCGDGQA